MVVLRNLQKEGDKAGLMDQSDRHAMSLGTWSCLLTGGRQDGLVHDKVLLLPRTRGGGRKENSFES